MNRMTHEHNEIEMIFDQYLKLSETPNADRAIIEHYIEHGEYGIALSSAISIYEEGDANLSSRALEILLELAKRMKDAESGARLSILARSL
jgi:hypothetical protein